MTDSTAVKGKHTAMWFLFFLAPVLGELLSGSSPPPEFFNPLGFIFMTILYGGGALLVREAKIRWGLGWSVIFLAIAYGVLEEGVMVQSFFNHHHADLGPLSRYGMFLGTQWPWSIALTMYHGTVSTTIPILITDLLFPTSSKETFLKKKGIIAIIILLVIEVIIFSVSLYDQFGTIADPYIPNILTLFIWTLVTLALVYLAYRYRDSRRIETVTPMRKPITLAFLAFVFQLVVLLLSQKMSESGVPAIVTVASQLVVAFLLIRFVLKQIYNAQITVKHKSAIVFGTIMAYILLTPIHEYEFHMPMIETGITAFVLLIIFMIVVNLREMRRNKAK